MIKEETQPPQPWFSAQWCRVNYDYISFLVNSIDYDYVTFLVNSVDYDYLNCNRLRLPQVCLQYVFPHLVLPHIHCAVAPESVEHCNSGHMLLTRQMSVKFKFSWFALTYKAEPSRWITREADREAELAARQNFFFDLQSKSLSEICCELQWWWLYETRWPSWLASHTLSVYNTQHYGRWKLKSNYHKTIILYGLLFSSFPLLKWWCHSLLTDQAEKSL